MGAEIRIQALILLVAACNAEPDPKTGEAEDPSDCSTIQDWQDRLDCAYDKALPLVQSPDLEANLATLDAKEDRDMVLYRLAVNHPQQASRLCQMVVTRSFVEKCQQVVGRPHLGTTPRPSQPGPQERTSP